MNIGVAVSTHNRREIADHSIEQWKKFLPVGAKLVIVDDASDIPYPGATFRFDKQAGVPVVKNKCLELLDNCTHIFLADDDIYPINEMWWSSYVYSNLAHACFIFDREKLWSERDYVAYNLPRGCLLYFSGRTVQIAGGFNTLFSNYGYEHPELSRRIFNMGLTPAAYIDIPNSANLFYSHDKELTVRSSVPVNQRGRYIVANRLVFNSLLTSKQFVPYK